MVTIPVQLPDDQATRLREIATRLQVSVEELAAVGIRELLAKSNEQFEEAARYVLNKNAELYRRLA